MKTMAPIFFETQQEFRTWLEQNHQTETELIVGFYKVNSGKPSMTWSESVDQALCFGWIDGIRKSIDTDSYQIRFTPRKSTSIWSAVNIKKIELLTQQGLMFPAGLASYKKRTTERSEIYTYENEELHLTTEFERQFKENPKALEYFQTLAPSYLKLSINWIMSAKQEATRVKRFQEFVADCETGTNKWKDNKYSKKANNLSSR
jgi:uncharacterized protein YdeI (YjbR/CyaY-like superfamily)